MCEGDVLLIYALVPAGCLGRIGLLCIGGLNTASGEGSVMSASASGWK